MLVCWWTSICCLLGAGMIPARPQQNLCMCYISRFLVCVCLRTIFPIIFNKLFNKDKHMLLVTCLHCKIPSVKQTLLSFHMVLIYREENGALRQCCSEIK